MEQSHCPRRIWPDDPAIASTDGSFGVGTWRDPVPYTTAAITRSDAPTPAAERHCQRLDLCAPCRAEFEFPFRRRNLFSLGNL